MQDRWLITDAEIFADECYEIKKTAEFMPEDDWYKLLTILQKQLNETFRKNVFILEVWAQDVQSYVRNHNHEAVQYMYT